MLGLEQGRFLLERGEEPSSPGKMFVKTLASKDRAYLEKCQKSAPGWPVGYQGEGREGDDS